MAKSKKAEKLTSKELEGIKELQQKINNVLMNLGNAQVVQNQLVGTHSELQADWKKATAKLEKKYGNVNISLEDGAISEIEEEAPALVKA
tara:strand:+ start:1046 stop:1315 length:270 start_codon:yes stop_codon:yes gene_type:complete